MNKVYNTMKVYTGENSGAGPLTVRVEQINLIGQDDATHGGYDLSPKPSQGLWNHSPDGFQWGYGGSGPAQLALAILLDVTGDKQLAVAHHQEFKRDLIATAGKKLTITEAEVRDWLKAKGGRK